LKERGTVFIEEGLAPLLGTLLIRARSRLIQTPLGSRAYRGSAP